MTRRIVTGALVGALAVAFSTGAVAQANPQNSAAYRLFQRFIPSTHDYHGNHMLVRVDGRLLATPLLAVLIVVEVSDVIFAVDSIPAVFAVTEDPFIVYTSNVFAILGLRALYFLLAGMAGRFRYLHIGLGIILAFVGVKMLITELWHIPTVISLAAITIALGGTIAASLLAERRELAQAVAEDSRDDENA